MRDTMKNGKALAIQLDARASCKMEQIAGNWGRWAIVRDKDGQIIGKHRTTVGAWEAAYCTLKRSVRR